MLCKILRKQAKLARFPGTISRKFASSDLTEQQQGGEVAQTQTTPATSSIEGGRRRMQELKDVAYMDYKEYPTHIPHWNPESPDYVASPREEELLKRQVDGYNDIIDNLKHCLQLQEELYQAVERMDRPYLTSGRAGLDKNVYDQVQDYSNSTGHNYQNPIDVQNDFLEDMGGNIHRYIRNEVWNYEPSKTPSNILKWQQEVDERPVNPHFNADKGYKFDVAIPFEDRHPHIADRLGRPYILGDPIDRLLRLEQDIYHPAYLDQPFVQTPPVDADADINFGEGEVVYENPNMGEWGSFWQSTFLATSFFQLCFIPYHYLVQNRFGLSHLKKGVDLPFFEGSYHMFDNYGLGCAIAPVIIYMHIKVCFDLIKQTTACFPIKMQYNQDQDILFLTVPGEFSNTEEVVVEMDHIELAPASIGIGNAYNVANMDDGYYFLTDLNSKKEFIVRMDDE